MTDNSIQRYTIPEISKIPKYKLALVVLNHDHLKAMGAKDMEIQKLQKDIQCMVKKAADKHLPAYRKQGREILDKQQTIEAQAKEIERLKKVMNRVKDDLVMRADLSEHGYVGVSSSIWMAFCEELTK